MEGYQPKKGILMKRNFKKLKKEDLMTSDKLPRGGFGLEKHSNTTFVKPTDRPAPPPQKQHIRGQRASDIWMSHSILCHSCKNKDICKYQGDYLEKVVHIIDTYDGVFELNCGNYEYIQKEVYKDKIKEEWEVRCDNKVYTFSDYISALSFTYDLFENGEEYQFYKVIYDATRLRSERIK